MEYKPTLIPLCLIRCHARLTDQINPIRLKTGAQYHPYVRIRLRGRKPRAGQRRYLLISLTAMAQKKAIFARDSPFA